MVNGEILKGKITGITKFGAFVELENEKIGMVHISEISSTFVKEIGDFVKLGQEVDVKVISIAPDGKIALSMKQVSHSEAENKPEKLWPLMICSTSSCRQAMKKSVI